LKSILVISPGNSGYFMLPVAGKQAVFIRPFNAGRL
jgi:hypothetical protein